MKSVRFVEANIYLKNKNNLQDYFWIQHFFMMLIVEFSLQSHKEYEVRFGINFNTIRYCMSLLNYNCYIWQSKANFEIFVAIY